MAVDVAIPHFRGASTHVYEVAKHLAKGGHEVHVISRRTDHRRTRYVVLNDVHIHRIYRGIVSPLPSSTYEELQSEPPSIGAGLVDRFYEKYLFTVYALYAGFITSHVIKRHDLEVIIERETSFGAGGVASFLTGRPMVLEIIGPRYSRFSFTKSKKILAYTESMIRDPVSPEKLELVTAAADIESFKPNPEWGKAVREKYDLQNCAVVGYIGTFAPWHGLEELVDASLKVIRGFSNVRFLMVGPYFNYARRLAEKNGVSRRYIFTGPVPYEEVPKYINAADILVAPYNPASSELRSKYGIGSPLKVFEYMACGKPVITTSVEPITRVIHDGHTGRLVPPGDSEALSEAIIHLIRNAETRDKIGRMARQEVERHYSWKAFITQLEKALREAKNSSSDETAPLVGV